MLWLPWRLVFCRGQVLKSACKQEIECSQMTLKDPSRLHALGNSELVWKLICQFLRILSPSVLFLGRQRPTPLQHLDFLWTLPLLVFSFLSALVIKRLFVGGCHGWMYGVGSNLLLNSVVKQYEGHSPSSQEDKT